MATAVEHNEGCVRRLDNDIAVEGANFRVRLFKNNFTPVRGDAAGAFTEANFSGYAAVAPVYGASALDANNNAEADAASIDFTHNGGGTANDIYGAYQTDAAGKVRWSYKFTAPVHVSANGDKVTITPKMFQGQIVLPL